MKTDAIPVRAPVGPGTMLAYGAGMLGTQIFRDMPAVLLPAVQNFAGCTATPVSAQVTGLACALACAGFEASVVEMSWYGEGEIAAPLERRRVVVERVVQARERRLLELAHALLGGGASQVHASDDRGKRHGPGGEDGRQQRAVDRMPGARKSLAALTYPAGLLLASPDF